MQHSTIFATFQLLLVYNLFMGYLLPENCAYRCTSRRLNEYQVHCGIHLNYVCSINDCTHTIFFLLSLFSILCCHCFFFIAHGRFVPCKLLMFRFTSLPVIGSEGKHLGNQQINNYCSKWWVAYDIICIDSHYNGTVTSCISVLRNRRVQRQRYVCMDYTNFPH